MAKPLTTARDADPYADRRAYPRVPVALPAFLQADGERHFVHLLDLSPGGAKLKTSATFPVGTAVVLDCGTLGRSATVRWQDSVFLGIAFDSELDPRDVSALADRSTALAARMTPRD
jgi:hypothetical protein